MCQNNGKVCKKIIKCAKNMGKSIESVQKDDKICQNNGKVCQKILKPKIWVNQFKVCKKVIKYVKIYGQINSKCAKE